MTRISVVIPCRDAGPWVVEMLESLTSQARKPDEIVMVDDGSTDGSAEVVQRWIDSGGSTLSVQVLRRSQRGVAAATREAIGASSGELVVRVDADDLVHPDFLLELERALDEHPEAAYAYPAMRAFGAREGRYPTQEFDAAALVYAGNFVCAAALMRRDAYDKTRGYAELPAWEDWDLWLSFLEVGGTGVLVDRELYLWRRHERSRNTLSVPARRALRLRIWWRHSGLLLRHWRGGARALAGRVARPVRDQ